MRMQFKLECCNRVVPREICSEEVCRYCGKKDPICSEVDKEDMVFMHLSGFSGDKKYEDRQWGSFQVLLDEAYVKVKKIIVKPNHRLSLQLHRKRDELWKIISGEGELQIGQTVVPVSSGSAHTIKKFEVHRVKNTGDDDLIIIEIQTGECQEDDIIRIEDDYGR